jgi:hypothetical protein
MPHRARRRWLASSNTSVERSWPLVAASTAEHSLTERTARFRGGCRAAKVLIGKGAQRARAPMKCRIRYDVF